MNPDQTNYTKIINYCLFFSLAFLLCTKNFSVGVVAVLLITSLVYIGKNYKNIQITSVDKLVIVILSAYFIASIPVYFKDMETTRYFKGSARYLLFIPIYFLIKNELKTPELSRKYIDIGIIFGSIGTLAIALYQYYLLDMRRVDGFLYSINFGYLACSLAFLALTFSKDSKFQLLLIISFLMDAYATTLTLTRGAIFVIPILLIAFMFLYDKQNQIKRIISSGMACLVLFSVMFTFSPSFNSRINYTANEFSMIYNGEIQKSASSGGRISIWNGAINSFLESPLIGQTFKEREEKLKDLYSKGKISKGMSETKRAHAHNQYFEMLASYGILGVIAFILLLFVPLIFFLKRIYQTNYALSGFIFVAGFSLFCMTEVPLEQNLISTYYGLMLVLLIHFTVIDIDNKKSATKSIEQ